MNRRHDPLGRPFWTLVGASGLSNLADGIFKTALPLVAIVFTRSPALVAGLELARSLPWLLGALQVGALTDRLDRRRIMLGANTVRVLFVAVPAVALLAGHGSLWLLYVAAVGTGIAEVFYDTAAQSFLPSLVPVDRLDRANGRLYSVELGAQEFAGPPLAGFLVAAGLGLSFASATGLWVVALAALLTIRGNFRPAHRSRATIRADIKEGLAFVLERPVLRNMAVMVGISNMATTAAFTLFVLFAVGPGSQMGLTEPQFGLLFSLVAVGGVVGGSLGDRVQRRFGRARTLTATIFGISALTIVPAVTAEVVAVAAGFLVGGFSVMVWNVITVSFRQRITPEHLLGRVNSAYRLVAWGTRPMGAALGGMLGEAIGVRGVFAVMAIVSLSILIPNRAITDAALEHGGRKPAE